MEPFISVTDLGAPHRPIVKHYELIAYLQLAANR